MRMKNSSRI